MEKTYRGSCHCKKVRFEANLDLSKGTSRCNCSFCAKVRNWSAIVKSGALKILAGESDLASFQFTDADPVQHLFCKHCGSRTFNRSAQKEVGLQNADIFLDSLDLTAHC